jgi:hypothetical protein
MRLIARRTPRPANKPTKLGEHPNREYGTFITNTPGGQVQFLDARHRTQTHVEDRMKQFKACGARNLPSIAYGRNAAWLQLAALATSLTAWLRHIGLDGDLAKATTKTLRFRVLSAPARLVTHARRRIACTRLDPTPTRPDYPVAPAGHGTGAHPSTLGHLAMPTAAFPPHNDPQLRRSRGCGSAS